MYHADFSQGNLFFRTSIVSMRLNLSIESKLAYIPYGYLYSEKGLKEAIPEGWHLPSKKEWETMIRFAKKDSRCKDVLSVIASEEWIDSSSDKYGFSMVPGGRRDDNDDFELIEFSAHFWCVEKTVDPISHAIGREKFYTCVRFEDGCDEIDDEDYPAYASVRLIKDAE